ncbi:DUF4265 domain-containing protein [Streptomyces sp. NPDC005009]
MESLWAVGQGGGTARLDNFPRLVRGIACGDVVATADLTKVQKLLNHGVAKKWWDMKEGRTTAQWRAASADRDHSCDPLLGRLTKADGEGLS